MKATGVVRRIDELGRIVIPKEIRRTLKIKEGTPLEIFTEDSGQLLLKKYSPIVELGELAREVCESIFLATEQNVLIVNMENVIASSGPNKNTYLEKTVDSRLEKLINARMTQIVSMSEESIRIFQDNYNIKFYVVSPIMANGDVFGAIIIFDEKNDLTDCEKKIAQSFADYIGKQLG